MGRLVLRVLNFGFSPWTIFTPDTILGEIYFLLNMLGNVHTHGGGKGEGREGGGGGKQTRRGISGVRQLFLGKNFTGGEDVYYSFFFIVAFILCWMWMDGWMRIWDACSIKEREPIYVILYIECFFLTFYFFLVIDVGWWMFDVDCGSV